MEGANDRYAERRLERTVTLPKVIDSDQVEAHYRNGVLELHLTMNSEVQPKRIEVRST